MQTNADLRIGMLVLWHGQGFNDEDIDDVGIVIGLPGENWSGCYRIAWSIEGGVSDHSPDSLEESLYQQQLEIVL
jgi:hypothetical protein